MSNDKRVNRLIRGLMILKNKSKSDLAKECGIAEISIDARISRGAHKLDDLVSYAKALGVDIGFKDGDNFYSFISTEKDD